MSWGKYKTYGEELPRGSEADWKNAFMIVMVEPIIVNEYDAKFDLCKTKSELKKQYAAFANTLHPDKGGDNDEFVKMKEVYLKKLKSI